MSDKKIHIRLGDDLHRQLRVRCAYQGTTLQDFVEGLISEQLTLYPIQEAREPAKQAEPRKGAPRQGVDDADDLRERAELETRYADRLREHPELRWLASYTPNRDIAFQRWFRYKEAFSHDFPQLAVSRFRLKRGAVVLDPFCGAGTVLLAVREMGYAARGVDGLPLAVFVSRVKLRTPEEYDLGHLRARVNGICSMEIGQTESRFPDIVILPKAFTPGTANEILYLRDAILQEEDVAAREFLLLGLLSVMEEVSHTCKDGLGVKLRRRRVVPRVQEPLRRQLAMMLADLTGTLGVSRNGASATVAAGDARDLPLKRESVSAIITSPPYLNRYDYARIYSLELALSFVSSFGELRDLRHSLLRGYIEAKAATTDHVNWGVLPVVLRRLSEMRLNNPNIPTMIKAYFEDMFEAIVEMARVCKPGAQVAMLIGNSRFGGEVIPVDLMLSEIAEKHGFATREIWVLHYKGNASQQMGRFGQQRVRESILFWQRT
jgi:DNA modification methylase